MFVLYYFIFI